MNVEKIRAYCIAKKGVTEEFPFDDVTLVFKVEGKMFALANLDGDLQINIKCPPEDAIDLRERYPAVLPGYHMNKKHWNTILMDGSIPEKTICSWIDTSYNLVVDKLPKKQQQSIQQK